MTEETLHKHICTYIKMQYPKVLFNTDLSGIKLMIGQAKKLKSLRSRKGFPDIFIYEPKRYGLGQIQQKTGEKNTVQVFLFCGLFLEIKKETPYLKDGCTLKKSDHLKEQNDYHTELLKRGFFGGFVWSFDQAKKMIDDYLKYE